MGAWSWVYAWPCLLLSPYFPRLICSSHWNKILQTVRLKQKFTFSQFWRLEVLRSSRFDSFCPKPLSRLRETKKVGESGTGQPQTQEVSLLLALCTPFSTQSPSLNFWRDSGCKSKTTGCKVPHKTGPIQVVQPAGTVSKEIMLPPPPQQNHILRAGMWMDDPRGLAGQRQKGPQKPVLFVCHFYRSRNWERDKKSLPMHPSTHIPSLNSSGNLFRFQKSLF